MLFSKTVLALADLTINSSFLDKKNELFYTNELFDNLYARENDGEYIYLLARSIGKNVLNDWQVKNEIEAFAVTDNLGLNYLIYGSVSENDSGYSAYFGIYSKKDEKVVKEIKYETSIIDKEEFFEEASFKINKAIDDILDLNAHENETRKIEKEIRVYRKNREFNDSIRNFRLYEYLGFDFSAGYAVPFGKWNKLFIGLMNVETGIKIVRIPYMFDNKKNFQLAIRPGFLFLYNLSKNKPEIVEEFYHAFSFKFPVDLLFILKDRYIINYSLGLYAQLDYYYQSLSNKKINNYTTAAFGWFTGIGFEYEIDKKGMFTIGVNNIFDFTAYDVFYFDFKAQVYFMFKFGKSGTANDSSDNLKINL